MTASPAPVHTELGHTRDTGASASLVGIDAVGTKVGIEYAIFTIARPSGALGMDLHAVGSDSGSHYRNDSRNIQTHNEVKSN